MVGSSRSGSAAVRMMVVSSGGSSSTFSSALAASWLASCTTRRSASPTTMTLRSPENGVIHTTRCSSRAVASEWLDMRSGRCHNGFWRRSSMAAARISWASSTCLSGSPALGRGMGTNQ